MQILRGERAEAARPLSLDGQQAPSEIGVTALRLLKVDAAGLEIVPPAPPPPPVVAPEVPAAPPAPTVVDVPGEVMQAVYEQAVAQGLEDGKAQVFAELTILQERYAAALDQLVAVTRELEAHNQLQVMLLACRVAEEVVRDQVRARPELLVKLITSAMESVEIEDEVTVHCSPMDQEFLVGRREALAEGSGQTYQVRVKPDPALEYGDFRVETRLGSLDGRVAARVFDVQRALTEEPGDD